MKAFRFRLQAPLQVREAERDAARHELAAALAGQAEVARALQSLEVESQALGQRERRLRQSANLCVEQLRDLNHARQQLAARRRALDEDSLLAAERVAACQQRLVGAECGYQALCRIGERRREEWRQQAARAELKGIDEAAMRGFRCAE